MPRTDRLFHVLLVAALLLSILPLAVSAASQGPEPAGFRAISGSEAQAFKLPDDAKLKVRGVSARYGLTADRYRQFVGKAEVLGGQLTVYRDEAGSAVAVVGAHYPGLVARNQVELNREQAIATAAARIGGEGQWIVTLMIHPVTSRYFYRVENQRFDSRWFHWIDAESGMIVNAYDGLAHGSGTGVLGDTKDLTGLTTQSGGNFEMVSADGRQTTYDARNRNRLPGNLGTDDDDIWDTPGRTSPGHPAMVDAHFYADVTDSYYQSTHGFNWTDYYPQGMVSSAHVQRNYVNAYWNGSQMAYGDGDGVGYRELSGDLDVVGHELSHGVTDATSDLIYQNESGALNEAFSDIMGTAIEYYYGTGNWTIGEDIHITGNGLRNMADPNEDGDPSHYADRYTGTSDNGGVHTNSGIANHWFYLLSEGGQNANPARASGQDVQGIGTANAEQVAFLGFTALSASATFCDARAGTIAVATGNQGANVADAWDEVGVDEALCGGGGGPGEGALAVTVSTDKASYAVNESVVITVHVEDDQGAAVQGATADVTIDTPKGWRYSGSGTTNASGDAVFNFTPKKRDGTGTYVVGAAASKAGYTPGSGSTTFTVN